MTLLLNKHTFKFYEKLFYKLRSASHFCPRAPLPALPASAFLPGPDRQTRAKLSVVSHTVSHIYPARAHRYFIKYQLKPFSLIIKLPMRFIPICIFNK
jgi:hypothetical protein